MRLWKAAGPERADSQGSRLEAGSPVPVRRTPQPCAGAGPLTLEPKSALCCEARLVPHMAQGSPGKGTRGGVEGMSPATVSMENLSRGLRQREAPCHGDSDQGDNRQPVQPVYGRTETTSLALARRRRQAAEQHARDPTRQFPTLPRRAHQLPRRELRDVAARVAGCAVHLLGSRRAEQGHSWPDGPAS